MSEAATCVLSCLMIFLPFLQVLVNKNPKWVKVISVDGAVRHENWTLRYEALQAAAGIRWPGYVECSLVLTVITCCL